MPTFHFFLYLALLAGAYVFKLAYIGWFGPYLMGALCLLPPLLLLLSLPSMLSLRAEISAVKAEENRLKDRRTRLEKTADRLMKILDRECAGQKTDLGVATFSYRKTFRVEVEDAEKAVRWLKRNKFTECFRIPAPEVAKAEVKKLISAGTNVPGCTVVQDYSCSLR